MVQLDPWLDHTIREGRGLRHQAFQQIADQIVTRFHFAAIQRSASPSSSFFKGEHRRQASVSNSSKVTTFRSCSGRAS